MIVLQSLKSFFMSNKMLSVAFSVLMVVCLIGGMFGINYACCNVDYYNRYISDQKIYKIYTDGTDIREELKVFLERHSEKVAYCYTTLKVSTSSKNIEVDAIIYISESYYELLKPAYGSMLSIRDIFDGKTKVILNSEDFDTSWIGKTVNLSGVEYEVVGLSASQYFIPFFSIADSTKAKEVEIVLSSPIKSSAEKQVFNDELDEIFLRSRVSSPDSGDIKSIKDYAPMLLPTAILITLGFINLGFLYVYFIKMREKQYSVFRICGASMTRILGIFLAEILLLYTAAYIVSLIIFKVIMASFFSYSASLSSAAMVGVIVRDCLTFVHCAVLYLILAALFVIAFIPSIIKSMKADITVYGGK